MGIYGSGQQGVFLQTPPRDLPPFGGRPIWISLWTRGDTSNYGGLAAFQYAPLGSTKQSAGPYHSPFEISTWEANDSGSGADTFTGQVLLANPNVWQQFLFCYQSTSLRQSYYGGYLVATNSTFVTTGTQTFNTLAVGTVLTTFCLATRAVAEVAFGTGLLSDNQIKALSNGANPLQVAPKQLLGYFPLRDTTEDLGPARTGLRPSAWFPYKWTDHPNVTQPLRRRTFHGVAVVPPPVTARPRITMVSL